MKRAFTPSIRRALHNSARRGGRRALVIRSLAVVAALALVLLVVARCEVDGGLLDANSEASREHVEQQRLAAQAVVDRDHLEAHKSDVHTDVITFAAALCSATESVRAAIPERNAEPTTVDAAFDVVRADLAAIGQAARNARDSVVAVPLPATDRVLTPGVDAETWRHLRDRAGGAFDEAATSADSIRARLDPRNYTDADAATAALSAANGDLGYRLTGLADTVNAVLAQLPIPNRETEAALRASAVCGRSDV